MTPPAVDGARKAVPRIAICGAGICGLTLAGILSRRLAGRVDITVLERAAADRDQGYGLDLNADGQEALARAGVYHRYWEISRPDSDSMAFYTLWDAEPFFIWFRPALMRRWFPRIFGARPETNRGAMRDVLLEAIQKRAGIAIRFEVPVRGLRSNTAGNVEVLGDRDASLGTFDLVIDAMGLHSTLRHHRVADEAGGKQSTGTVLLHGVIEDPDRVCGPEIAGRLARHGTIAALGRGYSLVLQRFGAGAKDNRTSLFYGLTHIDGEATLFREIGIEAPDSRASGIMRDERLDRVKTWVLDDMSDAFHPLWRDAIRCLDRVTIRDQLTHGPTSLRDDVELPIVCIGDSQRNCGLGGGGILAMQDAIELSKSLERKDAFDEGGRPSLPALRKAEAKMMKRKQSFAANKERMLRAELRRVEKHGRGPATLRDWIGRGRIAALGVALTRALGGVSRAWFRRDFERLGRIPCDDRTPIFPNVRRALESRAGE